MPESDYHGTVTGKLRPIVTMLTDSLVKDFCPAYRRTGTDDDHWLRTDEAGNTVLVTGQQLWQDVHDWLLALEESMDNDSDRQYARMVAHMIRKNPGWTTLLTNRVKKRL